MAGTAGCADRARLGAAFGGPTAGSPEPAPTTTPPPAPTSAPTTTSPAALVVPSDRVVVVVTLDGGNDAVNTLAPDLGSMRDLRPTIALPEASLLRHASLPGHGLHPALTPLVPHLDAGDLALVAGVGFPSPDRSHFASRDRWARADRGNDDIGWLGRWFDSLDAEPPPLAATALGSRGAHLDGSQRHPAAIGDVDAFAFPDLISHGDIRALASDTSGGSRPDAVLLSAARAAFAGSVGAVEEFDVIADAVRSRSGPGRDGAGPFTSGLDVAAELVRADVGARAISVNVDGFDTHSRQLDQHAALLDDLATGLAGFWSTLHETGDADRVLLLTTSEFGRRVAENGSQGTDHGSAGLSLVMGPSVRGGLYGEIDTDAPVDGDLAPIFDPRSIYTAALDWLGGDADAALGGRWDELDQLVVDA